MVFVAQLAYLAQKKTFFVITWQVSLPFNWDLIILKLGSQPKRI